MGSLISFGTRWRPREQGVVKLRWRRGDLVVAGEQVGGGGIWLTLLTGIREVIRGV